MQIILPSDIDLNKTNSEGVRMLRFYIEFARQGPRVLKPVEKDEAFETTDDFCKIIVSFLEEHGYTVETEVGCSDYKIDKDDIIFWKLLYKIYPELNGFYWMGQIYESLPALGRDMLERLWKGDKSNCAYWDSILGNKLLTNYLSTVKSKNTGLSAVASALETAHSLDNRSKRDTLMNYYTMAYLLSGQKLFSIGNKHLKNVYELTAHMKGLLDSSYEEFEDFCHSLIDYDDTLDVQFEAWLIAMGKRKEIETWRMQLVQ